MNYSCHHFLLSMKAVASSLFEEGAITVIYTVLMYCKSMLDRLSNSYGEHLVLYLDYYSKNVIIVGDYIVLFMKLTDVYMLFFVLKPFSFSYSSFRLPC